MSKRSKPPIDIVTETQQNSKWLFGQRIGTTYKDMSPSEWSRSIRGLYKMITHSNRVGMFLVTLITGIASLGGSILGFVNGYADTGLILGVIALIFIPAAILNSKNLSRKD